MSSQPWQQNFNVEDLNSSYKENLSPEQLLWLQIRACNTAHNEGDEMGYGNAVKSLLINVPEDIREEVEAQEDLYHKFEKNWRPALVDGEYYSADPERPDIINKKGTLRYNPRFRGRHFEKTPLKDKDGKETGEFDYVEVYEEGGPHQISPLYAEEEIWDYYMLQKLIMAALQEHGLTWKQERTEIFTGEEWDPAFDPPEEEEEDVELKVDEDERDKPQAN